MKATLHFDLSDGGEWRDFDRAVHAMEFALAIGEFKHWLREKRKYGDSLHEAARTFAEEVWDALHQALTAQGVAELVD